MAPTPPPNDPRLFIRYLLRAFVPHHLDCIMRCVSGAVRVSQNPESEHYLHSAEVSDLIIEIWHEHLEKLRRESSEPFSQPSPAAVATAHQDPSFVQGSSTQPDMDASLSLPSHNHLPAFDPTAVPMSQALPPNWQTQSEAVPHLDFAFGDAIPPHFDFGAFSSDDHPQPISQTVATGLSDTTSQSSTPTTYATSQITQTPTNTPTDSFPVAAQAPSFSSYSYGSTLVNAYPKIQGTSDQSQVGTPTAVSTFEWHQGQQQPQQYHQSLMQSELQPRFSQTPQQPTTQSSVPISAMARSSSRAGLSQPQMQAPPSNSGALAGSAVATGLQLMGPRATGPTVVPMPFPNTQPQHQGGKRRRGGTSKPAAKKQRMSASAKGKGKATYDDDNDGDDQI